MRAVKAIKYTVIFLLFCLFSINKIVAATDIILSDSNSFFEISPNDVVIFEDSSGTLGFTEVLSIPASKFVHKNDLISSHPQSTYWVKFTVNSKFVNRKKWVLEVLDSRHYEVDLFAPDSNKKYSCMKAGIKWGFDSRNYQHKNFVIDLNLEPNTSKTFYLKFNSQVIGSFLFKLRSNDEFSSYAFSEYYLLGTYYGIIFIIFFLNIILFLSLREKLYGIYAVYVAAWAWNSMLDDGIGFQYFWSNSPFITQLGLKVGKLILLLLFVFYSRLFLNLQNSLSKYDKWIKYSVGFYLCNFVINQFVAYPLFISFLVFISPFIVVYFISIKVHSDGYMPARFFIIGNTFILLGFIIKEIKDLNFLELPKTVSIIFHYSQNVGMMLEICTLFLALGDRFKFLKIQKEKAQAKIIEQLKENEVLSQKVNRELEEKVAERTKEIITKSEELKELNIKLELQAQEISKWNQVLDLDNHKLKQRVKDEIEARIKSEDVSYEKFLQIFPDELACDRYIDEIKWKDGFTCKKCQNNKYCKGAKVFSRRCTKCGYSESVTAYTFLHKCKFSLVKAFYIMMKVNKYGEEVNCAELARELEMRKSTVWEFKTKIMECKKGKQKDLDFLLLHNLK